MNNIEIEIKKKITFDEFKVWMNGLIYGKSKCVLESYDLKLIKQMMERVAPEVEIQNPLPAVAAPPVLPPVPYIDPYVPSITCGGQRIGAGLTTTPALDKARALLKQITDDELAPANSLHSHKFDYTTIDATNRLMKLLCEGK